MTLSGLRKYLTCTKIHELLLLTTMTLVYNKDLKARKKEVLTFLTTQYVRLCPQKLCSHGPCGRKTDTDNSCMNKQCVLTKLIL